MSIGGAASASRPGVAVQGTASQPSWRATRPTTAGAVSTDALAAAVWIDGRAVPQEHEQGGAGGIPAAPLGHGAPPRTVLGDRADLPPAMPVATGGGAQEATISLAPSTTMRGVCGQACPDPVAGGMLSGSVRADGGAPAMPLEHIFSGSFPAKALTCKPNPTEMKAMAWPPAEQEATKEAATSVAGMKGGFPSSASVNFVKPSAVPGTSDWDYGLLAHGKRGLYPCFVLHMSLSQVEDFVGMLVEIVVHAVNIYVQEVSFFWTMT
jgi:hypothetical protein